MTKYFSQDTPLAGLERMMMSVPGFQKRGGGMMVLCRFHYKKEDVDCTYCRSYMRHTCQESVCPYIPERLEAGTIGYQELAERCLRMAGHQKLWKRASSLSKGNTLPLALEPAHRHRLSEWPEAGTASICPQKLAAVYLLSSRIGLWRRVLPHISHGRIDFSSVSLRGIDPKDYPVYRAAKGLYCGKLLITSAELADEEQVIEIMVGRLYERWRISDSTDFSRLTPEDYPILSDLYALIEQEYRNFDEGKYQLYTAAILQEILLGLHSMCKGAESKFFNGHTNVTSSRFVVFGVKGLLQASKNVRSAMLFNVLSYLSDKLLTEGNTVAALDELYIWLSDNVAVGTTIIEYIRNCLKRVRKKESAMLLASQNLEDFNQEGIRELTKPLFAIPPHQFLFNAGAVDKKFYMEALQLEESEYNLIRFPQRGVCLYRCGNERYLLEVHAPAYKEALFGKAGGR